LAEEQFLAVSRGLFPVTLWDLLSRSSITFSVPPPITLTISMQIWTNYETHIFKLVVHTPDPLWLCHGNTLTLVIDWWWTGDWLWPVIGVL